MKFEIRQASSQSKFFLASFLLSFIVWIYCFKGFIFGAFSFTSDSASYIGHVKFLVVNLAKGVYPLWEPGRQLGLPFEFFLRRIGSYNPIFFVMAVFYKAGVPFLALYIAYLVIYYFIGMVGFYKLARVVLGDRWIAFVAYLLLLFSAWGTRLFDSYIYLTFIPMIWFFYFFWAFSRQPNRKDGLGVTFCLMLLVTTYIPFYFFNILLTFVLVYCLFYWRLVPAVIRGYKLFIQNNKIFSVVCLLCFFCALVPPVSFFLDSAKGEVVLNDRSVFVEAAPGQPETNHFIEVGLKTITSWGIEEDLMYSLAYMDMHRFKFAVVYLPLWAIVIFLTALLVPVSRKMLMIYIWGVVLFLMFTHRLPFYRWLHDHIFYFKYFRNLHFYLWFVLLPLFILLIAEQLRALCRMTFTGKSRWWASLYVWLIHFALGYFLQQNSSVILTSYGVLGLSLIFFTLKIWGKFKEKSYWMYGLIMAVIMIQPLETYHYLKANHPPQPTDPETAVEYNRDLYSEKKLKFYLPLAKAVDIAQKMPFAERANDPYGKEYYELSRCAFLMEKMDPGILKRYTRHLLYAYDHVAPIDLNQIQNLGEAFWSFKNVAFVDSMLPEDKLEDHAEVSPQAEILTADSPDVKPVGFNSNSLTLKTNFSTRKFLVYVAGYYKGWQVSIDNKTRPVRLTNAAFRGVWVPPGEHIVRFQFGSFWVHCFNYFLLALFYMMFLLLVFWPFKDRVREIENV